MKTQFLGELPQASLALEYSKGEIPPRIPRKIVEGIAEAIVEKKFEFVCAASYRRGPAELCLLLEPTQKELERRGYRVEEESGWLRISWGEQPKERILSLKDTIESLLSANVCLTRYSEDSIEFFVHSLKDFPTDHFVLTRYFQNISIDRDFHYPGFLIAEPTGAGKVTLTARPGVKIPDLMKYL